MEKILVFVPMYNCEKQIVRVLKQFDKDVQNKISEILLVNNRSTDNTENSVIEYLKKSDINIKTTVVRNNENYGLGGSHKVAFNYAINNEYDYLIVLHGDDQGNIHDILPILETKEYLNYDCMLGSRFMKGSYLEGYSKFRTFGNKVFNVIFSIFLRKKITDLGSGLNIYSKNMLKSNFYHKFPDMLTFNCYMLLAAKYYGHKIKFFPISWREKDQRSNVKMFSQALMTFKLVLLFTFNKKKYINSELRNKIIEKYDFEIIYCNRRNS